MKLVTNWRRVLLRAWSTQVNFLSTLMGFAAYLIPAIQDSVSPWTLVLIICTFCLLSNALKLVHQRSVSGRHPQDEEEDDYE
jgi:hypothetical protein